MTQFIIQTFATVALLWLANVATVMMVDYARDRRDTGLQPAPTALGVVIINLALVALALWGIWV